MFFFKIYDIISYSCDIMKKKIDNSSSNNYLTVNKMIIMFLFGSFLGVLWENVWGVIKRLYWYGKFIWTNHQGVIYGPFNPLYGFGLVLIILVLGRKKRHPLMTFLYGGILGGIFEYATCLIMEFTIGAVSWDYSDYILNINGRTTIPYMLFWGFAIMILIHWIYPKISRMVDKIPKRVNNIIAIIIVIFMSLDILVSWTALGRQVYRNKGYEPRTCIGEFYDRVYTDEFLKKIYRNMKFVK